MNASFYFIIVYSRLCKCTITAILAKLRGSEIMSLSISRILWHILVRVAYASLDANKKKIWCLMYGTVHSLFFYKDDVFPNAVIQCLTRTEVR